MTVFPFLAVSFIMKAVAVLFVICCMALVLIILVQKGRGGGLSAAFGGSTAGGLLGSKTGDFLTWVTILLVGIFLSLAIIMAKYYKEEVSDYGQPETTPLSQTTDQPSTLPVSDINVETGDTYDNNSIGDSIETPPELPISEEQQPPADSAESVPESMGADKDTNVPSG
jgi:preprotein translocase subunit SecG